MAVPALDPTGAGRHGVPMTLTRQACVWTLLLCTAGSLKAEDTPRTPPPPLEGASTRTVFSTTRRFLVSGFAPGAAADLARWSEDVAGRVEQLLGPIPMDRGWYLEIQGRPGDRVVRAQGWVDGLLQQRLEVGRSEELDQEDVLEGLVWLLLNRWAVARQTPAQRSVGLAGVPDWLAVGVAQNAYPELRSRNAEAVQERWREDRLTPWPDLVEQEILPSGRWAAKAEVGQWVAWLLERSARMDAFWEAHAKGQRLNAEAVARQVLSLGGVDEASQAWEVWLAAQGNRRRVMTGVDADQVAEFDALSRVDDPELQAVRADVSAPLTLADLVALRTARWVPALATRRSWQLQMAMLGRAPEWQEVAQRYIDFLEALAGRGSGYRGGLFGRGASGRQLLALLGDADKARDRLRQDMLARTAYVDLVEQGGSAASGAVDDDPAVRAYMDEQERRAAHESP